MKNKSFERLYQESAELTPRPEAKNEILAQAKQELSAHHVRVESKKRAPKRRKVWTAIAACCAMIAIVFSTLFGFYQENYQTVYVDLNPSISMEINRLGTVNDVHYLNADAEEALAGVSLEGKKAEKALEKILKAYAKAGYFDSKTAELYISAVGKNKKTDKLLEKLQKRAEKVCGKSCNVNVIKCTKAERDAAKAEGLSVGKYAVISQILDKYPDLTLDELRDKPMKDLKALLENG